MIQDKRERFEQIVIENQARVFSLALHFLRDRATAEEIAQDTFVQLHGRMNSMESDAHAALWLRRTVCHRCIDEARRRRYRPAVGLESVPEPAARRQEEDFLLNERVRRLVGDLPEQARLAVILRYQDDLEPHEIADLLEVPVSTVKSRLHRALASLKEQLVRLEVYS